MEEMSFERKVPIKRPDVVRWRHKYFMNIRNFRQAGSEIVFVDKRLLDRNLIFPKSCQTMTNLECMPIPTLETGL
jgi:hypothetical protein